MPLFKLNDVNVFEMFVSTCEHEVMLNSQSSNPDIVLGNRSSLKLKDVLDFPVSSSCFYITIQNRVIYCKVVNTSYIFSTLSGFIRAVIKFSKHDAWYENFLHILKTIENSNITRK